MAVLLDPRVFNFLIMGLYSFAVDIRGNYPQPGSGSLQEPQYQ